MKVPVAPSLRIEASAGTAGAHSSLYLSEKIWAPFGMEQDAIWMTSHTGQDIGGKRVLPTGWVAPGAPLATGTTTIWRAHSSTASRV